MLFEKMAVLRKWTLQRHVQQILTKLEKAFFAGYSALFSPCDTTVEEHLSRRIIHEFAIMQEVKKQASPEAQKTQKEEALQ